MKRIFSLEQTKAIIQKKANHKFTIQAAHFCQFFNKPHETSKMASFLK